MSKIEEIIILDLGNNQRNSNHLTYEITQLYVITKLHHYFLIKKKSEINRGTSNDLQSMAVSYHCDRELGHFEFLRLANGRENKITIVLITALYLIVYGGVSCITQWTRERLNTRLNAWQVVSIALANDRTQHCASGSGTCAYHETSRPRLRERPRHYADKKVFALLRRSATDSLAAKHVGAAFLVSYSSRAGTAVSPGGISSNRRIVDAGGSSVCLRVLHEIFRIIT